MADSTYSVRQSIGLTRPILHKVIRVLYTFVWQTRFSNRMAFENVKGKVLEVDYDEGGLIIMKYGSISKSSIPSIGKEKVVANRQTGVYSQSGI